MPGKLMGQCLTIRHLFCLLLLGASLQVGASVAVYVGKNLTRDGSVLLAGFGDEPSSHWLSIVPRQQHPEGARIRVGATAAADLPGEQTDIPQVLETYRYIAMDYSYFAGFPEPLTNGGVNEHGLAVRDVALFNRAELVAMTPVPQRGPHYADLARLVLERARTAREAVDVAADLIESHGYTTYGGNSHVFADAEEGWVMLQMAGGQGLWVARRLGPDDIWLNWRGYLGLGYIRTLPEDWRTHPDYLASDNFVAFAVEQGWHDPDDGAFDIIASYARPDQYSDRTREEARRVDARMRSAAPKVGVVELMEELHASGLDSSGYGQVAQLRGNVHPDLQVLWVAPASPLTSPFIPWRIGVESVPPEYRRHRYLTAGEAERGSIDPLQRGLESTRYVNRAATRLYYLVEEHREAFLPEVAAALLDFEHRQLEIQPDIERTARILLEAGEQRLARRYLTDQAHAAAGDGMRLIDALAASIEARTRLRYGIRLPEDGAD